MKVYWDKSPLEDFCSVKQKSITHGEVKLTGDIIRFHQQGAVLVEGSVIHRRPGLWQGAVGLSHHPVRLEDLVQVLRQAGAVVDHHSEFLHLKEKSRHVFWKLRICIHVNLQMSTCVRALQSILALPRKTCFLSTIQNLLWRIPPVRRPKFTLLTLTPSDRRPISHTTTMWKMLKQANKQINSEFF